MTKLLILIDYKGFFGSKQKAKYYRGGMDLEKLEQLFTDQGFQVSFSKINEVNIDSYDAQNTVVLYTSNEDIQGYYKSYIEDVIYNIEQKGFLVLPSFAYLKSHNNKVAMELLRERSKLESIKTIKTKTFGTIEELISSIDEIKFPVVLKPSSGAMSNGVSKAENKRELIKNAKKISKSFNLIQDIKELIRIIKHGSHYKKESFFRSKFIIQNLIEGLNNDWKVLVFGNKCFALYRGNRNNDFRASGSGKFIFKQDLPDGMLDFALSVRNHFNVPHISLDIGFDGHTFHLIEFQFLYFGTTTLEKSTFYFEKINNNWQLIEEHSDLEKNYVNSIVDFLSSKL
jgi:glutathione synthase/RimK-type ligase-like ATP-grasp enzyme